MRPGSIFLAGLALLIGCSGPERVQQQRQSLPDTEAELLLVVRHFGGGAGSTEWTYYLSDGEAEQRIARMTSLYPTRASFDADLLTLEITACKARVSDHSEASALPYGQSRAITIKLTNKTDCGYDPYPDR